MMRARLSLALAAALLVPASSYAVSSLSVGAAQGPAGSTVSVPVSLANGDGITAVELDLLYSTAQVTAVGTATEGPALGTTDHDADSNVLFAGRVRVLVLSNSLAVIPSGIIALVPMTLAGNLADGATVTITVDNVEMVKPDTSIVGGSSTGGSITVGAGCAVPGDIAPDGVGNGTVSLTDFLAARAKALQRLATNSRDTTCGNVGPAAPICTQTDGKVRNCPDPARTATFSLSDVLVIRKLALQVAVISCTACPAPQVPITRTTYVPGDVAPRGVGSGAVDIADVVVALRMAVGLETATASDLLAADVAPTVVSGAERLAMGNGSIDIGDVVLLLRSSVGLERLSWPQRAIVVRATAPAPRIGFALTISGWPAWATEVTVESADCSGPESGADISGPLVGIACATDPQTVDDVQLATVRYRGPAVDPSTLGVTATVANAALEESAVAVTLTSP
jgi:hypothetical protein